MFSSVSNVFQPLPANIGVVVTCTEPNRCKEAQRGLLQYKLAPSSDNNFDKISKATYAPSNIIIYLLSLHRFR